MAPTRPNNKKSKSKARHKKHHPSPASQSPKQLLAQATAAFEQGDLDAALSLASDALAACEDAGTPSSERMAPAACVLLGEIRVERGEPDEARAAFLRAADADPDGTSLPDELGGGPDKFLWLAQLSEDGGADSVAWFERGAAAMRSQIGALEEAAAEARRKSGGGGRAGEATAAALDAAAAEKRRKLAETLCAVAEVYMTDLSWEADAEQRCEALVTEATMLAPELPDAWQTVANVRVSQERRGDAVAALERSMALWRDLEPEDTRVPAFPTRVGLARLLMEVEMEERAVEVVERLVAEDDESVEAWYLGGLGWHTLGRKAREAAGEEAAGREEWKKKWKAARRWLGHCLDLFAAQEYEDERLGEHAKEMLVEVKAEIGDDEDDEDDGDDGWEDVDGDGDEEMEQ
ncbi:TPR domain-containing protein [Pleurostoma richardsiae]|uniref:TPR domain-containing protein n=1 Tax=Pleurostoma richardsiae TaxID=41990 RepID=A0AA38RUU3_9PEZI|nr:TPR domain-containing protein [Pleurostoma richardsiae]